ncbi:MAG: Uma2 family endonuclease [Holophaga sp.]|nr:Uma2 family endonuclease [Holophaga sp.]
MNLPPLNSHGHTVEEWKTWEGRWELINGVAYDMTPAPSLEHQRVSGRLYLALGNALEEGKRKAGGGECEVFAAPVDLYLPGQESVFQPDLAVICDPAKLAPHGIVGAPDLIVEILSPSTASRDNVQKRWAYAAAGVSEYLIVDPSEQVAMLLRLESGHYVDSAPIQWGAVVGLLGGKLPITLG